MVPERVVGQRGGEWGTKVGCEARGSKDRLEPLSTDWDLHLSLPTSHSMMRVVRRGSECPLSQGTHMPGQDSEKPKDKIWELEEPQSEAAGQQLPVSDTGAPGALYQPLSPGAASLRSSK